MDDDVRRPFRVLGGLLRRPPFDHQTGSRTAVHACIPGRRVAVDQWAVIVVLALAAVRPAVGPQAATGTLRGRADLPDRIGPAAQPPQHHRPVDRRRGPVRIDRQHPHLLAQVADRIVAFEFVQQPIDFANLFPRAADPQPTVGRIAVDGRPRAGHALGDAEVFIDRQQGLGGIEPFEVIHLQLPSVALQFVDRLPDQLLGFRPGEGDDGVGLRIDRDPGVGRAGDQRLQNIKDGFRIGNADRMRFKDRQHVVIDGVRIVTALGPIGDLGQPPEDVGLG